MYWLRDLANFKPKSSCNSLPAFWSLIRNINSRLHFVSHFSGCFWWFLFWFCFGLCVHTHNLPTSNILLSQVSRKLTSRPVILRESEHNRSSGILHVLVVNIPTFKFRNKSEAMLITTTSAVTFSSLRLKTALKNI